MQYVQVLIVPIVIALYSLMMIVVYAYELGKVTTNDGKDGWKFAIASSAIATVGWAVVIILLCVYFPWAQ